MVRVVDSPGDHHPKSTRYWSQDSSGPPVRPDSVKSTRGVEASSKVATSMALSRRPASPVRGANATSMVTTPSSPPERAGISIGNELGLHENRWSDEGSRARPVIWAGRLLGFRHTRSRCPVAPGSTEPKSIDVGPQTIPEDIPFTSRSTRRSSRPPGEEIGRTARKLSSPPGTARKATVKAPSRGTGPGAGESRRNISGSSPPSGPTTGASVCVERL